MQKLLFLPLIFLVFSFFPKTTLAQDGKFSVKGYLDFYYRTDFTQSKSRVNPYFVSSNRLDAFQVNLAYLHFEYETERYKFVFKPAYGTYMAANYAAEPPIFRNILEGYGSIKLSATKDIWLDAGIFGSPYTNESCINKLHLTYTRSFAPEYVPYYLSGLRLKLPFSPKVNLYVMALNGYQIIQNDMAKLSLGTHLEINPNDKLNINWTTFTGNTETTFSPLNRGRYFTDLNLNYNFEGNTSIGFCVYYGVQNRLISATSDEEESVNWGQANIQLRQRFMQKHSISTRLEYFYDPKSVQITPVNGTNGFQAGSFTLGYNYEIGKNALFRIESRQYFSADEIFNAKDEKFSKSANEFTGNLTFWF